MMNSRVLITGGTGFTGQHLSKYLHDQGWDIWIADLNKSQDIDNAPYNELKVDMTDPGQVLETVRDIQPAIIYHLAAQSSVGQSWENPGVTIQLNFVGSLNVLEAVRKAAPGCRVLLVGSAEEYGPVPEAHQPIEETLRLDPLNPYGFSKMLQSQAGLYYARQFGIQAFLTRSFNYTGPGQARKFVVPDFAAQIAEIEAGLRPPVMRVGNLTARRDFTDVRDVVQAYHAIAQKGVPGQIYHVGSGTAVAIEWILDQLVGMSRVPIMVEADSSRIRSSDSPLLCADTRRIQSDTGWKAEIPLHITLRDSLNYWREQIGGRSS